MDAFACLPGCYRHAHRQCCALLIVPGKAAFPAQQFSAILAPQGTAQRLAASPIPQVLAKFRR
jgi:hypothetical protein